MTHTTDEQRSEQMKQEFLRNVEERTTNADDVVMLRAYLGEKLVAVIPNMKGTDNSLKIYNRFSEHGVMEAHDIQGALTVFDPYVEESRKNPGKHKNIDVLLHALYNKHELRIERVISAQKNLLANLMEGTSKPVHDREAVALLDQGKIRCAEKIFSLDGNDGVWMPQLYAIDAMNAAFKNSTFGFNVTHDRFWDKVPLKTDGWYVDDRSNGNGVWKKDKWSEIDFQDAGVRFIPGSFVRYGSYVGSGTTVMPGAIVNTGAYVSGENTMIDGGARVATGAQVGKRVKLGAGSGIEGIIEPRGRLPTIIEDDVKIGANCELTGIIEEGAVIGSGVVMASGKKIFDLRTGEEVPPRVINVGDKRFALPYIPKGRIAVSGTYERGKFGAGCILLLEKDAKETSLAEIPPNAELYTR